MVMAMTTTAMAAEDTSIAKVQPMQTSFISKTIDNNAYCDYEISSENGIKISNAEIEKILKENFPLFSTEQMENVGDIASFGTIGVSGGLLMDESAECNNLEGDLSFLVDSTESLNEILNKMDLTKAEKVTILDNFKENTAIQTEINTIYTNKEKLSSSEIIKKAEKLQEKISPLFTPKQMEKAVELGIFENVKLSIDDIIISEYTTD